MGEGLDAVRKALQNDAQHVAIITEQSRHWYWAKRFVRATLGNPAATTDCIWGYADGKKITFHTRTDYDVDMLYPDPIRGYRGKWLFFGPAECDELLGVVR